MQLYFYISAFTLGFLGSFHCAGMCGPIALMLPKAEGSPLKIATGKFIYNTGRVATYIVIGILFGLLGLAIVVKGFQRELSVITGVIIILMLSLSSGTKLRNMEYSFDSWYNKTIRNHLKKLFAKKSYLSLFFIGVLNGLLPCGFVYLAIAGAASAGSVIGGATYMLLFGLGTFPMMMFITMAANYFGIRFRKIYSKISPFIAIALALFLIYRGTDMKTDDCCHKNVNQKELVNRVFQYK